MANAETFSAVTPIRYQPQLGKPGLRMLRYFRGVIRRAIIHNQNFGADMSTRDVRRILSPLDLVVQVLQFRGRQIPVC